jgi:hypothetical protein
MSEIQIQVESGQIHSYQDIHIKNVVYHMRTYQSINQSNRESVDD